MARANLVHRAWNIIHWWVFLMSTVHELHNHKKHPPSHIIFILFFGPVSSSVRWAR